ncbi:MAG: VWA domain-containing protein [Acidobacteria bacterium]|nr:VWA domain-containing protein [Acidobacteriota bacterium]
MTRPPTRRVFVALLLGAAAVTPFSAARQVPAPAAAPAVVTIDALVTRDGKPVTGLKAGDFDVRDGGAVQQVQLGSLDSMPVALLLALDTSVSLRGPALDQLKEAAKAAVSSLRAGDQAALLTFSQSVALRAGWTDDKRRLQTAIDATTAQGSTSLADAAFAALCLPPGRAGRTLVLIFSDGDDSSSWLSATAVVEAARRTEAVVYGITLSAGATGPVAPDAARVKLLEDPGLYPGALLPVLAHDTGGESLSRANPRDLRAAFLDVLARFNQRYVLTYTSPHAAGSGWHSLEVRVTDPALTVTARRGYTR